MADQMTHIPKRSEGLKTFLRTSVGLRAELLGWATKFANAYSLEAPVGRSASRGRLRAGAKPGVTFSAYTRDRPIGTVTNRVFYAVWNLTGAGPGMHTRSTGRTPRFGPFQGDYTYSKIIAQMRAT